MISLGYYLRVVAAMWLPFWFGTLLLSRGFGEFKDGVSQLAGLDAARTLVMTLVMSSNVFLVLAYGAGLVLAGAHELDRADDVGVFLRREEIIDVRRQRERMFLEPEMRQIGHGFTAIAGNANVLGLSRLESATACYWPGARGRPGMRWLPHSPCRLDPARSPD